MMIRMESAITARKFSFVSLIGGMGLASEEQLEAGDRGETSHYF
jgi:hypothetical protein